MNLSSDPQGLAYRFNDDEAVWRRYLQKRELRRLCGSPSQLPEEVLDRLDWFDAEQERRPTRYVGKPIP